MDWQPSHWIVLNFVIALFLAYLCLFVPFHVLSIIQDLLGHHLRMQQATDDNICAQWKKDLCGGVYTKIYRMQMIAPLALQWLFVLGIHFDSIVSFGGSAYQNGGHHHQRYWYQIGNLVFYVLSAFNMVACAVLMLGYDRWRSSWLGRVQMERDEIDQAVSDVRRNRMKVDTESVAGGDESVVGNDESGTKVSAESWLAWTVHVTGL